VGCGPDCGLWCGPDCGPDCGLWCGLECCRGPRRPRSNQRQALPNVVRPVGVSDRRM